MKSLYTRISLKNKIVFSFLIVTMGISVSIAFLARWILVSSLTNELELRGRTIAHSIAERSGQFILDHDEPKLLSLIVEEAGLKERKHLIDYIFVTDPEGDVLRHTLVKPFPPGLRNANPLDPGKEKQIREIQLDDRAVYDIAEPIKEGLYTIGAVHVGLNKEHIDSLVSKLRNTFLGFISLLVVIIFILSTRLSQTITKPISELTVIADELSRGNFDIKLSFMNEDGGWDSSRCPAFRNTDLPCWHFDESAAADIAPEDMHTCKQCVFYRKREGDEVLQLSDAFRNMIWSIKLYRHKLRESEEKYRSLFDSGPDPIFVVDCASGAIIDANPRALDVYGYPKSEMIGLSFVTLGPEQNSECLREFEGGGAEGCIYYPKMLHYRKGESPFFVNMHACPISYRGKPSIIIAATDITEMIEKDAQLIQAGKMKTLGEMSAGIAHELNQPLNAIKLGSEYLSFMEEQGAQPSGEKFTRVVSSISQQVTRAAEIINTLRDFGKKADLFKERFNINRSVNAIMSLVRRQFELANITFDIDLADDLPPILAHNNRLQQVFFNLVTNARDALDDRGRTDSSPHPRKISIRTYAEGDHVYAAVRDTGSGIPSSVRDKIFEPFFTTKVTGEGMGLGLAISYGIVRDYGGDIQIESEPGQGTEFRLVFPKAK